MSTRTELPDFRNNQGKFLRVNATETDSEWQSAVIGTGVQSVTDDGNGHVTVDNTDPVNPIIEFDGVSVDGVTITGTGLPGDPLVSTGMGSGVQSVTSGDLFIVVDNTDPLNPVITLDDIALASDDTFVTNIANNPTFITTLANNIDFINELTSNSTFITNISVNIDIEAALNTLLTTKGDLISRNTTTPVRVPVGTNGQVLTADSAQASGIKWADPAITGYGTIQDDGVDKPQETKLNFVDFFTVTDDPGVATDVDINVVELGNDNTFITNLTSNTTFQTNVNNFVTPGSGATAKNVNYLMKVGLSTNTAQSSDIIIRFGGKLLVYDNVDTNNFLVFTADPITGAIIQESNFLPFGLPGGYSSVAGKGMSVSEDKQTLYTLTVATKAFGQDPNWRLVAYDTTFTQVGSWDYTKTVGSGSWTPSTAYTPFFVYNDGVDDHLVTESSVADLVSNDGYWTDFIMAGGSALTTPTATNLQFETAGGGGLVVGVYAIYDSGNCYQQRYSGGGGVSDAVEQRTYSSLTFGSVSATNLLPIPNFNYNNYFHGGFDLISSTVIGRWRNTSFDIGGATPPTYLSGIYNEYSF